MKRTAVSVAVVVALAGCADGSQSSEDLAAGADTAENGLQAVTCEELIPEIVNLTADEPSGEKIITIYQPKTELDRIEDFNAKTFTIPLGSNKVEVLTCSGSAQYDDAGQEVPITYGLQVDVNNEIFVRYNVI